MSVLRLAFTTPLATGNTTYFQTTDPHVGMSRIMNLVAASNSGAGCNGPVTPGSVTVNIDGSATAATGTVTCASVQAGDTVTVGNITFTAHASTNTGLNFALGASDTACGTNLAAAINRHATISLYFSAANVAGAVTLTAIGLALGVIGNLIVLSSSNNTRLAVVALASGANDTGAKTYAF